MTSIVTDFPSIARKLNRQEQKAEFDAKNPPAPKVVWHPEHGYALPLKSMAHPDWPYAGTGFEWAKFVNVKI